jgi:hypothetical protein
MPIMILIIGVDRVIAVVIAVIAVDQPVAFGGIGFDSFR